MISVVIPAYNALADALACLTTLQRAAEKPQDMFWVVQDDASPDVDMRCIPNAAVMRNERNLGFAGNCNTAAARAFAPKDLNPDSPRDGDILFFVNQDVLAVPEWSAGWDTHLSAAFADSGVGIVGARLLFPDRRIQSAGGQFDAACQPFHRCFQYSDPTYEEVNTPQDVSWVTGAALAIRRGLFEQVGGFDTAYTKGYFEDTDLCMKVREAGYRVRYEPRVTFIHKVGSAGGSAHFMQNARLFKSRWVDTGKARPDTTAIHVRYW